MALRTCSFIKPSGARCGAPPLREGDRCFWHAPEKAEEVADAQRAGGQRRKRERTLAVAFAVDGIRDADQAFRVLEIALMDTLALDNGVPRNRTLVAIAQTALRAHEVSDLEDRMQGLEQAVKHREPATTIFNEE